MIRQYDTYKKMLFNSKKRALTYEYESLQSSYSTWVANYSGDIGGISTATISNYYDNAIDFIEQSNKCIGTVYSDGYSLDADLYSSINSITDDIIFSNVELIGYINVVAKTPDCFNYTYKQFIDTINDETRETKSYLINTLLKKYANDNWKILLDEAPGSIKEETLVVLSYYISLEGENLSDSDFTKYINLIRSYVDSYEEKSGIPEFYQQQGDFLESYDSIVATYEQALLLAEQEEAKFGYQARRRVDAVGKGIENTAEGFMLPFKAAYTWIEFGMGEAYLAIINEDEQVRGFYRDQMWSEIEAIGDQAVFFRPLGDFIALGVGDFYLWAMGEDSDVIDNYNDIMWSEIELSGQLAAEGIKKPFQTVFNADNAYDFFFNPNATDAELENYASSTISSALMVYGTANMLGIKGQMGTVSIPKVTLGGNGILAFSEVLVPVPTLTISGSWTLAGGVSFAVGANGGDYEVTSHLDKDPGLEKAAEVMGKNQSVQKEANNLIKQYLEGNTNPGIGTKNLFKDIYYLRGRNGARVFYRIKDGVFEILGKSSKANEQKVINLLIELYK